MDELYELFEKIDLINYNHNNFKKFRGFNNSVLNNHKSKRKNFMIEFTITDFYNENIVILDNIVVKARNIIDLKNRYSNNDLKNIIGLRHYPRKLGYINILNVKGV